MEKTLVIIGGGGHCGVVLETISDKEYNKIYIEDENCTRNFGFGVDIVADCSTVFSSHCEFIVAIGDNYTRNKGCI